MDNEPFNVTVTYAYTVDVIPPRCRKPRPEEREGTVTIPIPQVTAEDAPVVLRVPVSGYSGDEGCYFDLRGYAGQLYTPTVVSGRGAGYVQEGDVVAGAADFAAVQPTREYSWSTQDVVIEHVLDSLGRYLIIEGLVWQVAPEPVYGIFTMGLGGNHGGTLLDVLHYVQNEASTHPATDHAEAVDHAVRVATDRGDLRSIPNITRTRAVLVLDPAYVTHPHLVDLLAGKELELLAKVAEATALLGAPDDGSPWHRRIDDAIRLLQEARKVAWSL